MAQNQMMTQDPSRQTAGYAAPPQFSQPAANGQMPMMFQPVYIPTPGQSADGPQQTQVMFIPVQQGYYPPANGANQDGK